MTAIRRGENGRRCKLRASSSVVDRFLSAAMSAPLRPSGKPRAAGAGSAGGAAAPTSSTRPTTVSRPGAAGAASRAVGGAGTGSNAASAAGGAALAAADAEVEDVAVAAAAAAVIVPPKHQHEARLPDNLLLAVLGFLPPHAVAQTMQVCHRWKAVSQSEILWRGLCKRAISTFHPKPGAARVPPPPTADAGSLIAAGAASSASPSASDAHAAGRASAMVAAAAMVDPLAALSFDYSATSAAGPAPAALVAAAGAASAAAAPIPRMAPAVAAAAIPSAAPVVAASRSTIGTDTGDGHDGARGVAAAAGSGGGGSSAAGTDERQYSLSVARQRAFDEDFATRSALKAVRDRVSAARAAVLEALKANLKRLDGSYRAAFFHIPLVRRRPTAGCACSNAATCGLHHPSLCALPRVHAGVDARRVRAAALVHPAPRAGVGSRQRCGARSRSSSAGVGVPVLRFGCTATYHQRHHVAMAAEVLEVVYSRVFKFNDDGTLVYAMLPGELGR